jgi:putative peptide zinc metalloprotease protein
MNSPSLVKKRGKAVATTISLGLAALGLLGFMPIPSYTLSEGVVWLPDEALIKAEQDGFVGALNVHTNEFVSRGTTVLTMNDDMLESKARIARAKLLEAQVKYRAERESDLVKAQILKEELRIAESELGFLNSKIQSMTLKTSKSGHVLLPDVDDLPGRYLHHGDLIGYVLDENPPTIRMVATQNNVGQLRERIVDIKVRLTNARDVEYDAAVIRLAPEAVNKLPSPALATLGGGQIQVDPNHEKDLVTLQKIFWVDLKFNPKENNIPLGARVYVRINHGSEPIAVQWYRRIRQAFLRHFNV